MILRQGAAAGVELVTPNRAFDARVLDGQGRELDHRALTLNDVSSTEWTWRIPAEAPLGSYRVIVSEPGLPRNPWGNSYHEVYGSFEVAAFRTPDFRVTATLAAATPVMGATLHATVDARYLFGASLGPQPVRWREWHSPTIAIPEAVSSNNAWRGFAFGYYPERTPGTDSAAHDTKLDAAGHLSTNLATSSGNDFASGYQFEGDVEGLSRQHIAGRAWLAVYPASVLVGLKQPPGFVNASSGASIDTVVLDLQGRAVAEMPVHFSLFRREWFSATTGIGGYQNWKMRDVPAGEVTVQSAPASKPVHIAVPSGGSYVLRATTRDNQGRPTRTDLFFYATGAGEAHWRFESNRINLVPENASLTAGETARIMIQSPWQHATALLTVEREGVRSYRRFEISSTQDGRRAARHRRRCAECLRVGDARQRTNVETCAGRHQRFRARRLGEAARPVSRFWIHRRSSTYGVESDRTELQAA